jgi:hypothetical protein
VLPSCCKHALQSLFDTTEDITLRRSCFGAVAICFINERVSLELGMRESSIVVQLSEAANLLLHQSKHAYEV